MKNIVEVYCIIDNFVKKIDSEKIKSEVGRRPKLSKTDYIFLSILKQEYGFKTNKQLYEFVKEYMVKDFPPLPSYQQFNQGLKSTFEYFIIIVWILTHFAKNNESKYHIVDSTPVPVCNNQYRFKSKVFKGLATSGKNINGWFFGFKIHIIINLNMDIESFKITDGSTKDLDVLEGAFIDKIKGWLVGDKGYIGQEKAKELSNCGITLLTRSRKNMKKIPALPIHNFLLSKRQTVESVFSYFKYRFTLLNSYARSVEGFFVNVFSAVSSYIFKKSEKLLKIQSFSEYLIS